MIDWYTKSILTVIGGALTVLAIGQLDGSNYPVLG